MDYTADASADRAVHLTNYAIQKKHDSFGEDIDGNQLNIEDFKEYLSAEGVTSPCGSKDPVEEILNPTMRKIVVASMLPVIKSLNLRHRRHCFEVFGYDFMVDENFGVWLIECNTNPCLEQASDRATTWIMPMMLDDMFKIVLDPLFPNPAKKAEARKKQAAAAAAAAASEKPQAMTENDEDRRYFDLIYSVKDGEVASMTGTKASSSTKAVA